MKRTQGDIQVLLSSISMLLALVLVACDMRIAAASSYVDPITDYSSREVSIFTPIDLEQEDDIEQTIIDDDIDPLTLAEDTYYEPIEEYVPRKNVLARDSITINSDLFVETCPSIEALDALIAWWNPKIMDNQGTVFLGHGKDFYEVWEISGMDPLIILGIAAWEGGWGNSKVAKAKYNFYGIGVYDSDPMYWASRFSDGSGSQDENVTRGIIDGALWIYENYYLEGNTTLALINNNGYNGYNGGTYWAETITEQMINVNYRVIKEIMEAQDTTKEEYSEYE